MARLNAPAFNPLPAAVTGSSIDSDDDHDGGLIRRRLGRREAAARHPLRSPPGPRDLSLSDLTHTWWRKLPPALQPHELCILYPHIANRIALCWNDLALSTMLFASLLVDQRGGRQGFPAAVQAELLMLHATLRQRAEAAELHAAANEIAAADAAVATESATASAPAPV